MKMSDEYELTKVRIQFYKLVNGSITIGYIALAVWALVKLVEMF